ncbi:MAG: hypothetical protein WBP10_07285 [Thermoanaerobaculia bacterium]|jgi:hypothetical protein
MKRRIAVFTIVQNEPIFLPVWSRYYRRHVPEGDLFVLDHDSTDAVTVEIARRCNRVPVHRSESFNHGWLRDVVMCFQTFLLQSYELVLFCEVDEIVAPDPVLWPNGLAEYLQHRGVPESGFVRCLGYEIVHQWREGEPRLDWQQPLLKQRRHRRRSDRYSKPALAGRPLEWDIGFHELCSPEPALPSPDPELLLLHLHRVDFETCRAKTLENASRPWSAADVAAGAGYQNRIEDDQEFERWFYTDFYDDLYAVEPIPEAWQVIL